MASFFRRGNNSSMIPPVEPTPGQQQRQSQPGGGGVGLNTSNADGNRSALFSGLQRSGTATSSNPPPSYRSSPAAGPSSSSSGPGDPYGDAAGDSNRAALFGDYQPRDAPVKERKYGYDGREQEEDFDEDEEIEGIKQEMRGVKQESLASTRNALRIAREAEDTARGTLSKLGDQSERIANTERHLDIAKANNQRAEDKAAELKQLNRSIFRPVITWNKVRSNRSRCTALRDFTDIPQFGFLVGRHSRCTRRKDHQPSSSRARRSRKGSDGRHGYASTIEPGCQSRSRRSRLLWWSSETGSDGCEKRGSKSLSIRSDRIR